MNIRRVVTGHNEKRKSIVALDGRPPWSKEFEHTPGFASALVWSTSAPTKIPAGGEDVTQTVTSFVPGPGGSVFLMVTFPPDSVMADPSFDPVAAGQEFAEESPGLVDHFEPDAPGMHTTPTVDYGIVLDGEIWLELDDGETVHLKTHDVIVQNNTRHAWRNKSTAPTKMAFVLLGGSPSGASRERS